MIRTNKIIEYFFNLLLNNLSLKRNIIIRTGTDKSIGCALNESARLPLTKAKNALVIPQVRQGICKNFCTRHPVSKYHIPNAINATENNIITLWNSFNPFIGYFYCFAPLSNISRALTLAAKQSARHLGLSAFGVSSLV